MGHRSGATRPRMLQYRLVPDGVRKQFKHKFDERLRALLKRRLEWLRCVLCLSHFVFSPLLDTTVVKGDTSSSSTLFVKVLNISIFWSLFFSFRLYTGDINPPLSFPAKIMEPRSMASPKKPWSPSVFFINKMVMASPATRSTTCLARRILAPSVNVS